MGLKEQSEKIAKNEIKKQVKKLAKKVLMGIVKFMLIFWKFFVVIIALVSILSFFTWLIGKITAEGTPKEIYNQLEVEQISELVEIKGNNEDGYHLEFVEGIDEKLDNLITTLAKREGLYTLRKSDKELLKDMLKAEVVTQFPDLGGSIDENNSNQFQGAITVRRITPDKQIGEMKSTGAGEKTTVDDLKADNNVEDKKITYETWQELEMNSTVPVYLKGTYDTLGNKTSDDGITAKSDTMLSKIEGIDNSVYAKKADKVFYTGNTFYYNYNTYIEIAKEKEASIVMGYIKNINVDIPLDIRNNNNNTETDKEHNEEIRPTKTIGDGSKEFVIAIAAAHNAADDKGYSNGDLVEEELTIQVANRVERLFKEYSNVKVVQTGSTTENKVGVKRENRTQLAKNANPDLCIQIDFNGEGQESGIEVCYEYGDGRSHRLAELLSEKIANAMNLENIGAQTKENISDYYDTIDSSADTGFPSVITKGGSLKNKKEQEVLKNGGIYQYASGIVEACVNYLSANKGDDTVTYIEQNDTYSRINSRIYDLTYVPLETFQQYIDNSDKKALDVYTLDESYNLVTANWKLDGTTENDTKLTINKNSAMSFRTILQKVHMPYEYLLFYLIDSEKKEFVQDFADMVINDTEIIIAIQDNITTKKIDTTVQRNKIITSDTGNGAGKFAEDWHEIPSNEDSYTENCSSSVEITYADTWFMKYSKGNGYSAKSLNVDKGEKIDIKKNVKGKVTETENRTNVGWNNDNSGGVNVDNGSGGYTLPEKNPDTGEIEIKKYKYNYAINERKETITHTISNTYESGEATVDGNESKFVKLFNRYKMANMIAEEWLFDMIADNEKTTNLTDLTKYLVYKAEDVDFGVTEYDFSEFDFSLFEDIGSSMGGLSTFKEYLHAWEGHTGISEDGTKYRVGDDGAGHPTVGYGIDIYNGGFLDRFKEAGYDVSIGSYIDIEFVDALEDEEIQSALQAVESKCAGLNLTQYQKYALVSRVYNCGISGAFTNRNGKTFVEAYNAYWNPEEDDKYKVPMNDGMYDHLLYTNYMSKPNTSGGKYMAGLEKRRKSEWILFQTGYYDRIDKWCSEFEGDTRIGPITLSGDNAMKMITMITNGLEIADDDSHQYIWGAAHNGPSGWDGNEPQHFDCSSFVGYLYYKHFGIYIGGHTGEINSKGQQYKVSMSELQPGDILWRSGHVGMYIGNNQYVHASSPERGILVDPGPDFFTEAYRYIK